MRKHIVTAGFGAALALGIATPYVMNFEGYVQTAAPDPVGIPTACFGATHGVKIGQKFTREECEILLSKNLGAAIEAVDRLVTPKLDEYQYAAFGSFVYNVGEGAFRQSSMLKKLNHGDIAGACNELPKWVYAKGKKLPGLVQRRETERALCLTNVGKET